MWTNLHRSCKATTTSQRETIMMMMMMINSLFGLPQLHDWCPGTNLACIGRQLFSIAWGDTVHRRYFPPLMTTLRSNVVKQESPDHTSTLNLNSQPSAIRGFTLHTPGAVLRRTRTPVIISALPDWGCWWAPGINLQPSTSPTQPLYLCTMTRTHIRNGSPRLVPAFVLYVIGFNSVHAFSSGSTHERRKFFSKQMFPLLGFIKP